MQSYKTVKREANAEFVEKRSRFIGYVCPVTSVGEADSFIASVKKKHFDAKHNVYAYILREGGVKKYSDDGEPQGTAGMPVLDIIEKNGLCDVCIVVTRYFGGILLGGGGLFRAYTQAAKLAVDAGEICEMRPCSVMSLECDYNFYSRYLQIAEKLGAETEGSDFGEKVKLSFCIALENEQNISDAIFEASGGRYRPVKLSECHKASK